MAHPRDLVYCCLTKKTLNDLEQKVVSYNLQASVECGPSFSLPEKLLGERERNPEFLNLVATKRLATLRRIERKLFTLRKRLIFEYSCFVLVEKMRRSELEAEKKAGQTNVLKEEHAVAVLQKQRRLAAEMEQQIALAEKECELRETRDKLIKEEA